MKAYLNSLNDRERWMLIAALLCLFAYGYFEWLYGPLKNKVTTGETLLLEKNETLLWMKEVKGSALTAQKKQSIENGPLLTLLATQLKKGELVKFPYQLQQTGSGDIQLSFDEVPFKAFMRWLATIDSKYIISIKQFNVNPTETPGLTKLTLILTH